MASNPNYFWRRKPLIPTANQRILAQWRGIDLTSAERMRAKTERDVGSVVPGVLQSLGLERRRGEAEIAKVWSHLMTPDVVAHAHPINIAKGTLFVSVDNNVWLDEIVRYRRGEILQRLQYAFGKDVIKKISFRIG